MPEDRKIDRASAFDHALSTANVEQKIDVMLKTVTTAHVENKLREIVRPTEQAEASVNSGAAQSSGIRANR